jgi:minor fimbrial subunit
MAQPMLAILTTLYSNTAVDAGEDKAAKNIAVQLEGLANEAYGNGKTATIDIASAGTTHL